MRFFRRRQRLRSLSERECYARLHGHRSDDIRLRPVVFPSGGGPVAQNGDSERPSPPAAGPNRKEPALDLVFPYPRGGVTITGEDLRRELLARIDRRAERGGGR